MSAWLSIQRSPEYRLFGCAPGLPATLILLMLLGAVSACREDEEPTVDSAGAVSQATAATSDRLLKPGPIPATSQREGNPERGRDALLNESYVSCGLPLRVFEALSIGQDAQRLTERPGPAAELPYFTNLVFDESGQPLVANTCLSCHASSLFGELVIGLGNEFADFTQDPSALVERAGTLVRGPDETRAWQRYADRIAAIAPHMQMRTVGSNPANNLTFALIAHRDAQSQAWLDEPGLALPGTEPPPVSVPPWWRMAKKHALFNLGEGRGDHARFMMAASMMCTDSRAELAAIDAYAPDIRAYIVSIEPPRWPFDLDTELAGQGRAVFEQTCSRCHGTYGPAGSYPNLVVALEGVGTDPYLADSGTGEAALEYVDWFNRSYYGELATAAPARGYVAPPLDGIWATAPYLHNGSVPTLAALLNSPTRPERWYRLAQNGDDPELFDVREVGWKYRDIDASAERPSGVEPRRVYDTSALGHGNAGHTFGDALSVEKRQALIEYLKSL